MVDKQYYLVDRRSTKLEELLGGRVLAWVGAVAVLVGIFFLLVIAVSRGWIGEAERTVMAGLASLGLLMAGARLLEARGRTDAALAASATGIAGLFGTLAVAGVVYELVPAVAALLGALAVGAVATALALRWETPGIGALGIVGALLAPALVGAQPSGEGVALLAVATGSATAVLVWQRWNWLAFAAFAIATPQWLLWIGFDEPSAPTTVATLVVFGLLAAAAAVGFELRARTPRPRTSSAVLLVLNALVLDAPPDAIAGGCPGAGALLALAAVAAGCAVSSNLVAERHPRLPAVLDSLGLAVLGYLTVVALDGPALTFALTAEAVVLTVLARREGSGTVALGGAAAYLAAALAHLLAVVLPPDSVTLGAAPVALLAGAAVAAALAWCARAVASEDAGARAMVDGAGLCLAVYVTAAALGGAALTAALAGEAVLLALLARHLRDTVFGHAAVAFLLTALADAVGVLAPPDALVTGVDAPLAAAAALGSVALAAAVLAAVAPDAGRLRGPLAGGAALVVLHLASVELVTPFQPGAEGLAIGELGVRQQGQALLSALWALTGFGALVAGLLADRPALRRWRAGAAAGHGRQGLPLRPRVADLDLPRGLVHRARPAAAGRRVRLAAGASPAAAGPARDAGGPALTSGRSVPWRRWPTSPTTPGTPTPPTRSCSRPRPARSSRS